MVKIPSRWHPEKPSNKELKDEDDKMDGKPDVIDDVVGRKRRIIYFHNQNVSDFHYGPHHPMKPFRLDVTHNLILNYGLHNYFTMIEPEPATFQDLISFHDIKYITELKSPQKKEVPKDDNVDGCADDVPVFDGRYDYCTLYTGSTVQAAKTLNMRLADIVINWSGGLHHAKKYQASGFCYVNDIVIGILELLKHNNRVLYIDIDIHHGDGVQEAFFLTDRVMTASFHHFGNRFFPGTGELDERGEDAGQFYSFNYPLREGITDEDYEYLFKPVIQSLVLFYQPNVIVMQCGADSLGSDKLGKFNLSFKGHGECVRYVKSLNVPLMILGGGGYRLRNVARCWTNETAIIVDQDDVISNIIPENCFYRECFAEERYKLRPELPLSFRNMNVRNYLDYLITETQEIMKMIEHAPSVQMNDNDYHEKNIIEYLQQPHIQRKFQKSVKKKRKEKKLSLT